MNEYKLMVIWKNVTFGIHLKMNEFEKSLVSSLSEQEVQLRKYN